MQKTEGALTDIVAELENAAEKEKGKKVKVGHMIDALDHRGYGPALAVLPLIEISPLGGIPGFPTLLALLLAAITIRLLMGYDHFCHDLPPFANGDTTETGSLREGSKRK